MSFPRFSGTPTTAASMLPTSDQPAVSSRNRPCRTSSSTTATRNNGLPSVRWCSTRASPCGKVLALKRCVKYAATSASDKYPKGSSTP